MAQQLKTHRALPPDFDVAKHVQSFEVDVTAPREKMPRLGLPALATAALAAVVALVVIAGLYFLLPQLDLSDETVLRAELAVLGSVVAFILVAANRAIVPIQIQESRRRFEFPEQFAESFQGLLDKVRPERVVIGIDNLDRCSPKRVAEVLSTIKTFLEPALEDRDNPGAKSLCFIIAADDEALRRHLIAEEVTQSAGSAQGADQTEDLARTAREAVDEYLRKFFNASIRITEMLDEDMQAFTKRELSNFVACHDQIDAAAADELIEITAQGLKRNPRRIKQFVNNLELRLQLFSDRRDAGHIQIQPEVMVVAKLAILEEEFPEEFQQLRRNPRLLNRWHRAAAEPAPHDGLNPELASFLRFTDHIKPQNIAVYLSLKQTLDEMELPEYREFIALLDDGDAASLTSMLETRADGVAAYAAATRRHFARQVRQRAWSRAHNALRTVLETPVLGAADPELADDLLDEALSHYDLKVRLAQLEPSQLLKAASRKLDEGRFVELLEALLSAVTGDEASRELRGPLFKALAGIAGQLSDAAREKLRAAFADESLRRDFPSYADLAEGLPEIVRREAVAEAIPALGDEFASSDPRLRVAVAGLRGPHKDADLTGELFGAVRGSLDYHRPRSGGEFGRFVDVLLPLVGTAGDGEASANLAHDIETNWRGTDLGAQLPSLKLALALCRGSQSADNGYGQALGAHVFAVGDGKAGKWAAENLAEMPPQFRVGFTNRLTGALAGQEEAGEPARRIELVETLDPNERDELLVKAAQQALGAGRFEAVDQLLPRLSAEEAKKIVRNTANELEAGEAGFVKGHPAWLTFIASNQDRLDGEQISNIAEKAIAVMSKRRQLVETLAPAIGRFRIQNTERRLVLVTRLIVFEREVQDLGRRESILRAAHQLAGTRPSNARTAINERLRELRESGTLAEVEIADRIAAE